MELSAHKLVPGELVWARKKCAIKHDWSSLRDRYVSYGPNNEFTWLMSRALLERCPVKGNSFSISDAKASVSGWPHEFIPLTVIMAQRYEKYVDVDWAVLTDGTSLYAIFDDWARGYWFDGSGESSDYDPVYECDLRWINRHSLTDDSHLVHEYTRQVALRVTNAMKKQEKRLKREALGPISHDEQ